ncbi:MAG: hypothetical protein NDJ89_01740 [Oligoflexia bacterium]|nr:hypothetical protein [Oligoflexia bacterium]
MDTPQEARLLELAIITVSAMKKINRPTCRPLATAKTNFAKLDFFIQILGSKANSTIAVGIHDGISIHLGIIILLIFLNIEPFTKPN